jgi:predicted DsbA family dithiol-disulfide isomerase
MNAYWRDGRNIEADDVLAELVTNVGLPADDALRAAGAPEYLRRIESTRHESMQRGVTGIPTVFAGRYVLVGCQPYDQFRLLAQRAGATPRVEHG